MKNKKMFFVGAGNMAEALIKATLRSDVSQKNLSACDVKKERLDYIQKQYSINVFTDHDKGSAEAFGTDDLIVLAVKPGDAEAALKNISEYITPHHVIVSIMAGVSLSYLSSKIKTCKNIARVMPNTAAVVGEAMSVVCYHAEIVPEAKTVVETFLSTTGDVIELPESQINAVTALSGSGPAYVFYLAECLIQAGKDMGLSREVSKQLAIQTIYGASLMMKNDDACEPKVLREKVTSPGGTTHAAISHFEENDVQKIFTQALQKAKKRSEELGK